MMNKWRYQNRILMHKNPKKFLYLMKVCISILFYISNRFVFFVGIVINENDLLLLNENCNQIVDANKEDIQKWSKEGTYTSFVCDQMKKLPVDYAERVQCASKILYLHYLIAFFKRSMFKRLSGSKF